MKTKVFIYFLILFPLVKFSSFSESLHFLKQIAGTERKVLNVFDAYELDTTSNYIYILFLPPSSCPRCEGTIEPLFNLLRENEKEPKIYLFVFFPQSKALKKYLQQKSFTPERIIIFNDNTFLENFWISAGTIQVPYITKFERKTGKLICASSLLGTIVDKSFAKWLVNCSTQSEQFRFHTKGQKMFKTALEFKDYINKPINDLKPTESFELVEDTNHPVSKIYFLSIGPNTEYISFQDFLTTTLQIFKKVGDKYLFRGEILPSEFEETTFIDTNIPKSYFTFLKKNNVLVSMYFNSTIINDNVYVSASLPLLRMEIKNNDTILSYFNSSTICVKNLENQQLVKIILFNWPDSLVNKVTHIGFYYDPFNKVFFLPYHKGWPLIGTDTEILKDSTLNPFFDSFYFNNSLFGIFDSSGNYKGCFGIIDDFYKNHKLGYFYVVPTMFIDRKGYFITTSRTGKIYFYNSLNSKAPVDSFQVFKPPMNFFYNEYDYQNQPLNYILAFKEILKFSIMDLFAKEDNLYSLIQNTYNEQTFLSSLNMVSKKQSYYSIPQYIQNYKFEAAKLCLYNGNVVIFAIYTEKGIGKKKVYIFKI